MIEPFEPIEPARFAPVKENENYLDKFRGCLIGGAAGDALGYPVEFLWDDAIFVRYGRDGISEYDLSQDGTAQISDDTQMTLFTATGLLAGKTQLESEELAAMPCYYIGRAYQTWYAMQTGNTAEYTRNPHSWLAEVPEMGALRAPGITCMSVIGSGSYGTVDVPVNQSKGCGGIMRVAPVGLYFHRSPAQGETLRELWREAAGVAALTHGHELGWLPAAMLAHIVNRLTYSEDTVLDAVRGAQESLMAFYGERKYAKQLRKLIDLAVSLARNSLSNGENIRTLGAGWVAEETLAIAVYCSLRYEKDFSKALCTSVNHDGDSDSTGAVTGNILGALWGYEKLPSKWKEHLECADVILEVADDLCRDCQMTADGSSYDEMWRQKYLRNRRYTGSRT